MSEPVGYALSSQQRAALLGGTVGAVAASVPLPGVAAEDVPAELSAVAARHEVFASTLATTPGLREPVQVVHQAMAVACDIRPEGGADEEVLDALMGSLDPMSGPVLRAVVAPTSGGCRVALAASAVFADLRSLTDLVAAVAGGDTDGGGHEEPIQYAEYAAFQADLLADPTSAETVTATGVWARLRDQDAEAPPVRLPRLAGDAESVGTVAVAVDRGGPSADPDPLAWWLTRWLVAVSRLTGERNLTLGVELDPRTNPELDGAVGPYARVVPLTFEVPLTGSLADFTAQVAGSLASARTWIEWSPALAVPPAILVSVGPSTACVRGDEARSERQVELRVADDGAGAVVLAASHALALRAAGALEACAVDGDRELDDLDLVDGASLGPAPHQQRDAAPVVARLSSHAAVRPDHVAVTDGRTTLTYAELAARVDGLAGALVAADRTGPVAVHLPRSVEALVAVLAAQRAGLGCVVLDVDAPRERIVAQAALTSACVWVTANGAPDGAVTVPPDASVSVHLPEIGPHHLAYVLFTSGSTGAPKGVAVEQASLAGYTEAVVPVVEAAAGRPGRDLVWGQVTGLTTDLGGTAIYGALAAGGTLHLVPSDVVRDPDAFSRHLAANPVDVLKITPTHLEALLVDAHADVLPREVLVLGGEALTWDLLDRVRERGGCRVVNHYGPTETTIGALTHTPAYDVERTGTVPVGRPLAGYEAIVVDERLRLVPPGAVGELLVAGVGVARGYVGDEGATAAAFVEHPYRPGVRAYRTGDLVRRDEDDVLTFVGRRDNQVKVRGFRVEPAEVERALVTHPSVRRAAVVLRRDVGAEPALVGYVVTQVNPSPSESDLRAHVAALLPEHMVPSRLVDLDTLPLRTNGKLDRAALPVPPPMRSREFEAPVGATETAVAAIFAESLGVDPVGAGDDFFALGGHSLLATRVVVEMRERLGVQLPVYSLFDAPTVRALARVVDDAAAAAAPSPEELAAMIAEISSLSDEEAARLLAEEAGAHRGIVEQPDDRRA